MKEYAWIIPFCPLIASFGTASMLFFFSRVTRRLRRVCALFNILSLATAMFISFVLLQEYLVNGSIQEYLWIWVVKTNILIEIGWFIDSLTIVMSILVTTVGLLVMIYSDSYMRYDNGYVRFFAYLSLFTASMLGLIFSPSLIQLYLFWELMAMCSYLLVGFRFTRSKAAHACQKAFITNRVGDFGLLLGILGLYWTTGSFEISELCDRFVALQETGFVNLLLTNIMVLLFFLGPVAKSAQFPLHVWLPDAMEGPTPISALIHAATMVAAGIFLIARIFGLISMLPFLMLSISWVGGITAVLGATLALAQTDLKKTLAYSTMSQLGYMVLALGIGAYRSALFHLITHAYSKALLFLSAGSAIHLVEKVVGYSPNKSQNMFLMGGLRKYMPITGTTFLTGTLSLCGIPPLACFWSKDEIITASWLYSPFLGLLTSITAGITAFYMCRIYFLTFEGDFRILKVDFVNFKQSFSLSDDINLWGRTKMKIPITMSAKFDSLRAKNLSSYNLKQVKNTNNIYNNSKLEESDLNLTIPLIVLSVPVLLAGFFGVGLTSEKITIGFLLNNKLDFSQVYQFFVTLTEIVINSFGSITISFIAMFVSFYIHKMYIYGTSDICNNPKEPLILFKKLSSLGFFVELWSINRGYIDYFYNIYLLRSLRVLSNKSLAIDRNIIDGLINVIAGLNIIGGEILRYLGSGRISHYLLVMLIGTIMVIFYL
uniref:NAD(P)H-quinone oxidoreductase subunit 5, chloroplastic n=1 Tax=Vaginularia trichoidea TaxID=474354 RepID=A0A3G5CTB2_9MONI|nr:NADH-plastoquinone oxidoreductase subunit 5 [Vaginularia trichoidea]AYW16120.1 NADH-plastoquinone oxidoreductase subunit 5 [Vaginularia trichoidea]